MSKCKDIVRGDSRPSHIKVTRQRDSQLFKIELYAGNKTLLPSFWLICKQVPRNTLKYVRVNSPYRAAIALAKHEYWITKPQYVFFGAIYLTTTRAKQLKLENSWYIFDELSNEMILNLWGVQLKFQLEYKGDRYGSDYVNFTSGEIDTTTNKLKLATQMEKPAKSNKYPVRKDPIKMGHYWRLADGGKSMGDVIKKFILDKKLGKHDHTREMLVEQMAKSFEKALKDEGYEGEKAKELLREMYDTL